MKKIAAALALLWLLALPAYALSRFYFTFGTNTGANQKLVFIHNQGGVLQGAFNARSVCVFNDDTANSIYASLKGIPATTSDDEIKFGDKWRCYTFDPVAGGDGWAEVDLITNGASVAWRVSAMR